jgi:hypothetical protein
MNVHDFETGGAPETEPTLDPAAVLVRTLVLPTTAPRQALAAARLRLDELSPAPASEVLVEVTPLGVAEAGSTRWAIGIVHRAQVVRACAELGRDSLTVTKTVEGQEVVFRFRDPAARLQIPEQWSSWAGPAAAGLGALALLLLSMNLRVDREMDALQIGDGGAQQIADRAWRLAADRDVAVRSWMNAERGDAARLTLCGLDLIARETTGRKTLMSLDGSPGAASFALAGGLPESLAKIPGATVSADAASADRRLVRVEAQACPKAATP